MTRVPKGFFPVALCCIAAGFAGHWLYFRATHVSATYAFVKAGVAEVGAPVEGQVVAVAVVAGQSVRAGDVLVRFDDVRQRAALDHARAAWEEAVLQVVVERAQVRVLYETANVTSSQVKARIEVSRAEARVANIDAALAIAMADRTSALRAHDMVAQEESEVSAAAGRMALGKAEQAERRVAVAQAQLGTAHLQQVQAKARESRLALLEASADTAQAEVRIAETELALRVVRAARNGVVSRRLVEPGSAVRVGGPLLEVWHQDDLSIEAWVDESVYGSLDVDRPVRATLSGLDDKAFDGRLEWLGVVTEHELKNAAFSIPVAKKLAQSRWIRARIVIDDVDARLLPGMTADVSIRRDSLFSLWGESKPVAPRRQWSTEGSDLPDAPSVSSIDVTSRTDP